MYLIQLRRSYCGKNGGSAFTINNESPRPFIAVKYAKHSKRANHEHAWLIFFVDFAFFIDSSLTATRPYRFPIQLLRRRRTQLTNVTKCSSDPLSASRWLSPLTAATFSYFGLLSSESGSHPLWGIGQESGYLRNRLSKSENDPVVCFSSSSYQVCGSYPLWGMGQEIDRSLQFIMNKFTNIYGLSAV